MLSTEKRPVELIGTDEYGLPRWVLCRWEDEPAERVLLLAVFVDDGESTVFVQGEPRSRLVPSEILDEIPPE